MSQKFSTTTFNLNLSAKMNIKLMKLYEELIYAHTKQIHDMVFHLNDNNILASVGLDSKISVADLSINTVLTCYFIYNIILILYLQFNIIL